jgi:hypothetical protein
MIKTFLITVFIITATMVTLSGLGYTPAQIKSFFVAPTATPSATVIQDPIVIARKNYNIDNFKNYQWSGEITSKVNGTIPTYMIPIRISMNYTFKIDELSIDFKNLDWNKQAKDIGITNTNIDGIAISIIGKGKIIYQNPWQTFVSALTKLNINTNPVPVSFIGYIDLKNKRIMFHEVFTNKPKLTGTETVCFPDPIGCIPPITKSWELKAGELWLRGMTYERGISNQIIMKDPVWDLKQKEYLQKSIEAATRHKGNVKMEASGSLKTNN